MSDHLWSQEQIETFVVGGLTPEEATRLGSHARECSDCAAAIADARRMDRGLGRLFAEIRSDAGLEDRAVGLMRSSRRRRRIILSKRMVRFMVAAGLLLAVGAVGGLANALVEDGFLPMPGSAEERARVAAANNLKNIVPKGDSYRSALDGEAKRISRQGEVALGKVEDFDTTKGAGNGTQDGGRGYNNWYGAYIATNGSNATTNSLSGGIQGGGGISGSMGGISGGISGGSGISGGIGGGMGGSPSNTFAGGTSITNGGTLTLGSNSVANPSYTGGTVTGTQLQQSIGNTPSALNSFNAGVTTDNARLADGITLGSSIPVRGAPTQQRPDGHSVNPSGLSISGGTTISPVLPKGFSQGTVQFGGYPSPIVTTPVDPSTPATVALNYAFKPTEHRPAAQVGSDPQEPGQETKTPPSKPAVQLAASDPEPATHRVVIRSGEMEFEVDSFDAAATAVTKLVSQLKGAFVANVNSEKLANGKMRGTITVRTPPEHLDRLVLDLRRDLTVAGELKGMKINSQDVTKQYTDIESRLRAGRTMEQRLLQIIKEGKGEIKELLDVEKELAVWRTKIEELEGEIRYYANLAALSTLTVIVAEKEARTVAAVTESERVQAGVEVEDVDKAYQQALLAVAEAKGRVTKSELKQLAAGQFNASMQFEVPPEASGIIRDRLRQLGRVARLEIDRVQQTKGGTPAADAKVKRGDAVFFVQIYNLANIAPRETATMQLVAADVKSAFQSLREAAGKANARVRTAQLNEQDAQNVTAQFDVEVKRVDDGAIQASINAAGEVLSRQVTRAPEGDDFTDSKMLYRVALVSASRMNPRETATLQMVAADVKVAFQSLRDAAAKTTGRVRTAQLNEQDAQNVTAQFEVEIRRADEAAIRGAIDTAGEVVSRQVARAPEGDGFTDAKVLYRVFLFPATRLNPRETSTMTLQVADVDQAAAMLSAQVAEAKGRQLSAESSKDSSGKATAKLIFDVPLAAAGLAERFKSVGAVREYQSSRDPQAPAGKFATVRLDVKLVSGEQIVSADDGLWPQVRKGLSKSVAVLLVSVAWLVFGLCVVLPWGLVGYGGYRLIRRLGRSSPPVTTAPPT